MSPPADESYQEDLGWHARKCDMKLKMQISEMREITDAMSSQQNYLAVI